MGMKRPGRVVAQHAGLSCAAEGQQEQRICPNHLVGLHSRQGPRGLHLQGFLPRLLNLKKHVNRLRLKKSKRTVRCSKLRVFE